MDVLEADVEFYMQFNPWKKPDGLQKVKTVPFEPKNIDVKEFQRRLDAPGFDSEQVGLMSKIKKVFSL